MLIKHLNMKIKVDQIMKKLREIHLVIVTLLMMDIQLEMMMIGMIIIWMLMKSGLG